MIPSFCSLGRGTEAQKVIAGCSSGGPEGPPRLCGVCAPGGGTTQIPMRATRTSANWRPWPRIRPPGMRGPCSWTRPMRGMKPAYGHGIRVSSRWCRPITIARRPGPALRNSITGAMKQNACFSGGKGFGASSPAMTSRIHVRGLCPAGPLSKPCGACLAWHTCRRRCWQNQAVSSTACFKVQSLGCQLGYSR